MYNCANLLSYSFYIESSFLLLLIFTFYMYMNQINKKKLHCIIIIIAKFLVCTYTSVKQNNIFFIKQEDLLNVKNIMLN